MKQKGLISFPLVYWLAFIVILLFICYADGQKRLSRYSFANGVVIDKIKLPAPWPGSRYRRRGRDLEFAQWRYTIQNDTFLFADKQKFTYNKPIGTRKKIIYLNEKKDNAMVYSFQFWVNTPLILILSMIAVFIFAICLFARNWNNPPWFNRLR